MIRSLNQSFMGYIVLAAWTAAAQDVPRAVPATPSATTAPPVSAVPQYDVVSTVRPSRAADTHLRIRMDSGTIFITDASLKDLLKNVYGMRDSQIVGLPKWAESEHFDIQAKVLADDPEFLKHMTGKLRREVFERVLRERFGAETHMETRVMAMYELQRVGGGPGVAPGLVENPPPPRPADGSAATPEPIKPGHNGRGNTSVMGTHLDATGIRISDLCGSLGRILDRSVVDKTGLASFYDVTLNWSDGSSENSDGPSLEAALQEQLGLKLVGTKGPVEVLVVDRAEKPKELD
ncbi:soil-associated protein, TIGR03435 family [Bryocella elongata]|uniref:Soil-associated protein, TIGR03435 family n=1 Tax=Bryocella elongata TaxID=863522 RepID=A0A1H5YQ44_9BACT|nr:TIGR03435 family protein [Bryocella elongata]SEG25516.1 soil-associated protein, TIGR03435 family [Bryocella elongata]